MAASIICVDTQLTHQVQLPNTLVSCVANPEWHSRSTVAPWTALLTYVAAVLHRPGILLSEFVAVVSGAAETTTTPGQTPLCVVCVGACLCGCVSAV